MTGPRDVLLVFPPFSAHLLRSPYVAPYYLAAYLEQRGHTASVLDLNRMALPRLFDADVLRRCEAEILAELAALEDGRRLTSTEVSLHHELSGARAKVRHALGSLPRLVAGDALRSLELDGVRLESMAAPMIDRYLFGDRIGYANVPRKDLLLADLSSARAGEFKRLFRQQLEEELNRVQPRVVGFSVPFLSLLLPALLLADSVKALAPGVHIVAGGPVFTLCDPATIRELLEPRIVDSIVKYEGERVLTGLVEALETGGDFREVDGLATLDNPSNVGGDVPPLDIKSATHFRFEYDAERFGPIDTVPILQSIGCYWGKCTFCDYVNLALDPSYRFRTATAVVDDIEEQVNRGYRSFRLIAEAIPPRHMEQIADELRRRGLTISWLCYACVDKSFTVERFRKIRDSGFVGATLGMETSDERLLRVVRKMSDASETRAFFERMEEAGVGRSADPDARWAINVIVDIPSTRYEEALGVYRFVRGLRHLLDEIQAFPFELLASSAMGRDPGSFGLVTARHACRVPGAERLNAIEFEDPHGMSSTEREHVLGLYRDLSVEMAARRRHGDAAFDAVAEASTLAELDGLVFHLEDRDALLRVPILFDEQGVQSNDAGWRLIDLRDRGREYELSGEAWRAFELVAGRKGTAEDIQRLLTPRYGPRDVQSATFALLKAMAGTALLKEIVVPTSP